MAGIYVHVPFCKQACHYCDFHFSASLQRKDDMFAALLREIALRADYLNGEEIQTIYFGGGTPSLLSADEINKLMDSVSRYHPISNQAEITLEANPDDLEQRKVRAFRHTAINRFSIGVQSFFEEDLLWMNRAHTAQEADSAIRRVQDAGFKNITADLIYGYPLLTDSKWLSNIQQLISYNIPHISAYSLTVEPKTALAHFIRLGQQGPIQEEQGAAQFETLVNKLSEEGFEHYEISNFAKPDQYAQHNTNYWRSVPYLGIGPSAHSFNGTQRQWNISHNQRYMNAILDNHIPAELENLSRTDQLNEYIMTALRTMWGIDLLYVENLFGSTYAKQIRANATTYEDLEEVYLEENHLKLTLKGKLLADRIAGALFFDED